jgi:hypothetical protein
MSATNSKASSCGWSRPEQRPVPRLDPLWAGAIVRASSYVTNLEFRLFLVLLDFDRHGRGMFVVDLWTVADEIACARTQVDPLLRSLRRKGLAYRATVTTATGAYDTWYPTLPVALGPLPAEPKAKTQWRRDATARLNRHLVMLEQQNPDATASSGPPLTPAAPEDSGHVDDSLEGKTHEDENLTVAHATGETDQTAKAATRGGLRPPGSPSFAGKLVVAELRRLAEADPRPAGAPAPKPVIEETVPVRDPTPEELAVAERTRQAWQAKP